MVLIPLRIRQMHSALAYLFDEGDLTQGMIHESTIHEAYNQSDAGNGKTLAQDLEDIRMTLPEFIRQEFPDKFHYVNDLVSPCFIATSTIRHTGPPALAAPPLASTAHPSPPGLGHSSRNSNRGAEHRVRKLEKQFEELGLSKSDNFHGLSTHAEQEQETNFEIIDLSSPDEPVNQNPDFAFNKNFVDPDFEDSSAEPRNKFRRTPPVDVARPRPLFGKIIDPPPGFLGPTNSGSSTGPTQVRTVSGYTLAETVSMNPSQEERIRRHSSMATEVAYEDQLFADYGIDSRLNGNSGRRGHDVLEHLDFENLDSFQNNRFFYTVLQGSITNSGDVNVFREQNYSALQNKYPRLFEPMPDELKSLVEEDDTLGPLIHTLQQLNAMFPGGMTNNDLIAVDELLCQQEYDFGDFTPISSLMQCIDLGLIYWNNGMHHVAEYIRDIELWHLPRGLTSNLYRLLASESASLIQDVTRRNGLLLNYNGEPLTLYDEDIVRQANCWPLLFSIQAQAAEQHSLRTAIIMLDNRVPKWKIMLDSKTPSLMVSFCDCHSCTHGNPPVVIPEHD